MLQCGCANTSITGRTGRIGHRGLATSFFTEADGPIASVLTRTLLETDQEVPDFLQEHVPEEGKDLKFEADSDFEPEEGEEAGGDDGWGSNDGGNEDKDGGWQ